MKISKTQEQILQTAKKEIAYLREFANFEDFFVNGEIGKGNTFSCAAHFNCAWRSPEKWRTENPDGWARMEKAYNDAVNEQIIIVFAKTESIKALERAGLARIIEEAGYKGGAETIKIL